MVLVQRTIVRIARVSSLCDVRYRFSSLLHHNPPKGITSSRRDATKSPTHRLNPRFEKSSIRAAASSATPSYSLPSASFLLTDHVVVVPGKDTRAKQAAFQIHGRF